MVRDINYRKIYKWINRFKNGQIFIWFFALYHRQKSKFQNDPILKLSIHRSHWDL